MTSDWDNECFSCIYFRKRLQIKVVESLSPNVQYNNHGLLLSDTVSLLQMQVSAFRILYLLLTTD
jgi:hypothetical protein